MTDSAATLGALWGKLRPADAQPLTALRVGGLPPQRHVYAAIDSAGDRRLLIGVADDRVPLDPRSTRALDVRSEACVVSGLAPEQFLVLHCRDSRFNGLFVRLAAEIVATLGHHDASVASVLQIVEQWRRFWSVDPGALSGEKAVGLLGELWFLCNWLKAEQRAVSAWAGGAKERHDFVFPGVAVEVKTTARATGPTIHSISGLWQLEPPSGGRLYLFSLRVREERLAHVSLPGLVAEMRKRLTGVAAARQLFEERLLEAGYTPAVEEEHTQTWQILSEELFVVDEYFPRLRPAILSTPSLQAAVVSVKYELDMAACMPSRVANHADRAGANDVLTLLGFPSST